MIAEIKAVIDMITNASKAVGVSKEAENIRALCAKIEVAGNTPKEALDVDRSLVMFAVFAMKYRLVVLPDDTLMFEDSGGGAASQVNHVAASAYRILSVECQRRNIKLPSEDDFDLSNSI